MNRVYQGREKRAEESATYIRVFVSKSVIPSRSPGTMRVSKAVVKEEAAEEGFISKSVGDAWVSVTSREVDQACLVQMGEEQTQGGRQNNGHGRDHNASRSACKTDNRPKLHHF